MESSDNAEIIMISCDQVDFQTEKTGIPGFAEDLAFIMENTAIYDQEENDIKLPDIKIVVSRSETEDSDSSSDSDVQIIKVKQKNKIGETICLESSSDEEDEKKISEMKRIRKDAKHDEKEKRVVKTLLSQLIGRVDRICKGNLEEDSDESDEETEK